jgi:septal ring factor EnvC (AmiA/AmiB activator)
MASTRWDDICKSVGQLAKKAGQKFEELSDVAALRLRISAQQAEIEEAYAKLGKLTYEHSYAEKELEVDSLEINREIASCIEAIARLREEIAALKAKIAAKTEAEFEGEAEQDGETDGKDNE